MKNLYIIRSIYSNRVVNYANHTKFYLHVNIYLARNDSYNIIVANIYMLCVCSATTGVSVYDCEHIRNHV